MAKKLGNFLVKNIFGEKCYGKKYFWENFGSKILALNFEDNFVAEISGNNYRERINGQKIGGKFKMKYFAKKKNI